MEITCLELTGDNESYNIQSIRDADIILTTPEKFDVVTRYCVKDGGLGFFSDVALVLIDEVHLLNDPRGAALEAIVSRIKMLARKPEMQSSPLSNVRFLAVSATIPNINDLGEWLMAPPQGIKRFGEEMRPVRLTTKVFGYTPAKNDFLFEKRLQNYIFDLLLQYSGGKSALIFCSTRKGAQEAAQRLAQIAMTFGHSSPFVRSRDQQDRLKEASLSCSDKQVQSYVVYGVGYHNGGLSSKDRSIIEGLFLNGDLRVLCTTNTLAHGINLPAHTVVIKSTQYFNKEKGAYMEYDRSMVLQMCGRAGRPPFDDTGIVIIMTRKETVHLYENLLNGCEIVESQLLPCMMEHLTAEIVQSTVSDITRAIEWMKCSFLYIRMKKSPQSYSFLKGLSGDQIEKHLLEICVEKVKELSHYQMVWTDEDGFLLRALEPGRLMTKYYLKFDTMKHIIQAPVNCNIEETLRIICQAEETAWIQLRRNEKKCLNDINNDKDGRLRYHVLDDRGKRKKRIQTREEKIFILVNDCLSGDPLVRDLSMSQDVNSICTNGSRIAKCMKEYFMYNKSYRGALSATMIAKCLHQKLWDDSPYLLKQLPGIGMVTAKALQSMGVTSFDTLREADPRKIELVTGRKYPFGNHIKESLFLLPPKVQMVVEESKGQKPGISKLLITLTRLSQPSHSARTHYADMIVGVEEENDILFFERIRVEDFSSPYNATVLFSTPQRGKMSIKANLIFEQFIGIDLHQKVVVTPPAELSLNPKCKPRVQQLCSSEPEDLCIINNDMTSTSIVTPDELIKNSISMPSFTLIEEDPPDDVNYTPVLEAEDDCKIITERTVFDHIKKKAKDLPVLPLPSDNKSSPSMQAFNLIRKRTREDYVDFGDDCLDLFISKSPSAQFPEAPSEPCTTDAGIFTSSHYTKVVRNISSLLENTAEDKELDTGQQLSEPATLTEETVMQQMRKKLKNSSIVDNLNFTKVWDYGKIDKGMIKIPMITEVKDNFNMKMEMKSPCPNPGKNLHRSEAVTADEPRRNHSFLGFQSVFSFL